MANVTMAKVYKLGTFLGWVALAIAVVYVVGLVFGEAILRWIQAGFTSKMFAVIAFRTLAILLISSLVAFLRELNNWRITFHPRLRVWREPKSD